MFNFSGILPLKAIYDRINARREINTNQAQNVRRNEITIRVETPTSEVSEPEYRSQGVSQRFFVDQANNIVIKK